jgi:hypothetical protein
LKAGHWCAHCNTRKGKIQGRALTYGVGANIVALRDRWFCLAQSIKAEAAAFIYL